MKSGVNTPLFLTIENSHISGPVPLAEVCALYFRLFISEVRVQQRPHLSRIRSLAAIAFSALELMGQCIFRVPNGDITAEYPGLISETETLMLVSRSLSSLFVAILAVLPLASQAQSVPSVQSVAAASKAAPGAGETVLMRGPGGVVTAAQLQAAVQFLVPPAQRESFSPSPRISNSSFFQFTLARIWSSKPSNRVLIARQTLPRFLPSLSNKRFLIFGSSSKPKHESRLRSSLSNTHVLSITRSPPMCVNLFS
ncbi:hypothetical protein [Ottowia caeni]|uniref:hypothetical protein n=1 Tax=Ottowia caeni TaxID=2870339 RepID=UPI003D75DA99